MVFDMHQDKFIYQIKREFNQDDGFEPCHFVLFVDVPEQDVVCPTAVSPMVTFSRESYFSSTFHEILLNLLCYFYFIISSETYIKSNPSSDLAPTSRSVYSPYPPKNPTKKAQMGSSQVKDEQIDIYMEVHKEFYMAGEQVKGIIFLNAKSSRQYSNLVLRLVGDEHVYWSEGSGKHRRSYSNRYQSYDSVFNVFDFQGQVGQGHYSFPFSFILSSTMSGSFTHSANCYIQYGLRAVLNHPSKQDHTQMYQVKLNIMEPMRGQLGGASITQTTNAQCCGCCKDYGHTTINLNSDKNFVMMGDSMNVRGVIDNSQGKAEVQRTTISFTERRVVISSGGAVRYRHDRDQVFHAMGKINPGQIENFNLQTMIPQWNSYTAIGRVTARYFLMMVSTELGCCANSPSAALHIVVNTTSPTVIKQNKMPPPENWYPHEAPKVMHNNMTPFVYQPLPGIPFHNIGQNNVSQNPMGQMGQQPYFQNDGLNGKYQNDAQYQQYGNQGNYQAF